MILSSVWSGSLQGKQILADLPASLQVFPIYPKKLKIVFVFKITNTNIKIQLSPLKTRLKERLRGRLLLFDIKNVTLVDHETAMKMGLAIASM